MRRRLSLNAVIVAISAAAALVLTITRPSPEGLISVGMGGPEVRAAPGTASANVNRHNLTALKVFNLTLVRVRDAYVDPVRISPKSMLYAALDSVEFDVPEVLVEPNKTKNEVVIQVNNKRQRFSTKEVDSPWRLSGKLKKVFRFVESNMNPGADLAKVEYAAVNGMLRTLDPHSVLLNPETAREMNVSTSGYFGGLGIVIRMYKRKLTVVRPIKDTPAARVGIKRGDHVARINAETTENLTLQEAVNRMRGKAGTSVTLWIKRKGTPKSLPFKITRARIRVDSVESKLLSKHVGYIRIKQFSGRTTKEVKEAMSVLKAQGAKAWVLDLRWNPGGLLEQAIRVSDLFLSSGTIVTTVGGREREPRRAKRKGTDTKSPIVTLVNDRSASASEIVAGALKNRDRSLVVGGTTFGKGSVQILYDNKDGSKLKLTIAQYLTPGDQSIQSVGVTPDVELRRMFIPKENKKASDQVRMLKATRTYREADLSAHLTSRYAKKPIKPKYRLGYVYEAPKRKSAMDEENNPLEDDEPLDDDVVVDFPIEIARDIAAAATKPDRKNMLRTAKKVLGKVRIAQNKKLASSLTTLGIDWSAPPSKGGAAPQLSAQISVNPGHAVNAGDTVQISGTVTNTGSTTAYQVHARVKSNNRAFDDTELVFGKIEAGKSRTWTTRVSVSKAADDRVDLLRFKLRSAQGVKAKVAPVKLRIKALARPVFAYSHQLIDTKGTVSKGNGDGLIQRGETLRLRVTIKNTGRGEAKGTTAVLRNTSGDGIDVKKGRIEIGVLKPGAQRTFDYVFETTDKLRGNYAHLEMTVYDSVLHESATDKLKYRIRSASAGPAKGSGSVRIARNATPIYEGASADSDKIGFADKSALFRVTGRQGRWTRIALGKDQPGFIRTSAIKRARATAAAPKFRPNWQVTPPNVTLEIPTYETAKSYFMLKGVADDDTKVEDVYIFVSNRKAKVDNRKVFYQSNRGASNARSMAFNAKIPLSPGSNRVVVVVRENNQVKSTHTMFLHRSTVATTARVTK